jgi:NitT/TauT family transport system ATP-binding protein
MHNSKVTLRIDRISKVFNINKGQSIPALDDFSLEIYENEFLAVVGPSGCGKTTLLSMVAGLYAPTDGVIYCNDVKVTGPDFRRGVVFQQDAVFPWLSVRKNVEYGPQQRGLPKEQITQIVDHYLEVVSLKDFENAWPKQLSGGMRKRVDLARALANDPEVLLMDEPFGALDVITKENLQVEIGSIFSTLKKTVLFITHDLEEAIFLADRVVVMTERPGSIKISMQIDFSRPRLPSIKTTPEFQEIRRKMNSYLIKDMKLEGTIANGH